MSFIQKRKFTIIRKVTSALAIVMVTYTLVAPFYFVNAACNTSSSTTSSSTTSGHTNPADPGHTNPAANDPCDITIDAKINNPLSATISDIPSFIEVLLNLVLLVGVPLIVLAIIYTGFLFVTSLGNSEKLGDAKRALMYTLIGAALLLGSWVIANAIKGTIDNIKSTT